MNGRTFQYNGWGQLAQIGLPPVGGPGGGGTLRAPSGSRVAGSVPPGGGGGPPSSGGTITIVYDPLGRVWSITDKDGVTRNYEYDGVTLIGEQSSAGGGSYRSYVSGGDGYLGDYRSSAGGSASGQQFYNYDVGGNLNGVYANPGTALWNLQHGFDVNGNPQEGPGGTNGYYANGPPTPMWGNGAYRDPFTGYYYPAFGGMAGNYDSVGGDMALMRWASCAA